MAVSGIESSQSIYYQLLDKTGVGAGQNGSAKGVMTLDTVEISDEARALIQKDNVEARAKAESTARNQESELPLEAYALPGWYSDLCSELNYVDTRIGLKYSDSRLARYDALSSREKDDLAEYNSTLHRYFTEELKSHGVESPADYYEQIVQNRNGVSDQVEQSVKERLAADPRALELMEYFGLSLES